MRSRFLPGLESPDAVAYPTIEEKRGICSCFPCSSMNKVLVRKLKEWVSGNCFLLHLPSASQWFTRLAMMTPFALLKAQMARGMDRLMTLLLRPNLRIAHLCEQGHQGCMEGDL